MLTYYLDNQDYMTLSIDSKSTTPINIEIVNWKARTYSWNIYSKDNCEFKVTGLIPNTSYKLSINCTPVERFHLSRV